MKNRILACILCLFICLFPGASALAVDSGGSDSTNLDEEIELNPVIVAGLINNLPTDQPDWFKDLDNKYNYSEIIYSYPNNWIPFKITKRQALDIKTLWSDDLVPIMYTASELQQFLNASDGNEFRYLDNLETIDFPSYAFSKEQQVTLEPLVNSILRQYRDGSIKKLQVYRFSGSTFFPCKKLREEMKSEIDNTYIEQQKFIDEKSKVPFSSNAQFNLVQAKMDPEKLTDFRREEENIWTAASNEIKSMDCVSLRKSVIQDKYSSRLWEKIKLKELKEILTEANNAYTAARFKSIDAYGTNEDADHSGGNFVGVDQQDIKADVAKRMRELNAQVEGLQTLEQAEALFKDSPWLEAFKVLAERYKDAPNCYSGSADYPGCKVKFIPKDSITAADFNDGIRKFAFITGADGQAQVEEYPTGTTYENIKQLDQGKIGSGVLRSEVATKFPDLSRLTRRVDIAGISPVVFKKGEILSKDKITAQIRTLAKQNESFPSGTSYEVQGLSGVSSQRVQVKLTYPQPNSYLKASEENVTVPVVVASPVVFEKGASVSDDQVIGAIDKNAFLAGTTYRVTKRTDKSAEVTLTYANGYKDVINVPLVAVEHLKVVKGSSLKDSTVLEAIYKDGLAEGTTYVIKPLDTSVIGEKHVEVELTYPDGSKDTINVPVMVYEYYLASTGANTIGIPIIAFGFTIAGLMVLLVSRRREYANQK